MQPPRSLVLLLLAATAAFPQIQTGRIVGVVYDPNKAVVPGATVTITNHETKVAQRFLTNGAGNYVAPSLDPGTYDLSVTSSGFKKLVQNGVEMQVGKDLLLDFDLVLG